MPGLAFVASMEPPALYSNPHKLIRISTATPQFTANRAQACGSCYIQQVTQKNTRLLRPIPTFSSFPQPDYFYLYSIVPILANVDGSAIIPRTQSHHIIHCPNHG